MPSSRTFRLTTKELQSLKLSAAMKKNLHGVTARQLSRKSSRFGRKKNLVVRQVFAERHEQRFVRCLQRIREVFILFIFFVDANSNKKTAIIIIG